MDDGMENNAPRGTVDYGDWWCLCEVVLPAGLSMLLWWIR